MNGRRMNAALVFSCTWALVAGSLYHEGSVTLVSPTDTQAYTFGYSVLLLDNPLRLLIGTPGGSGDDNGEVYTRNLERVFESGAQNLTCDPFTDFTNIDLKSALKNPTNNEEHPFYGATLVDIGGDDLLVCAPKWVNEVAGVKSEKEYVANGLCSAKGNNNDDVLIPLLERGEGLQFVDGQPYYAHGQAGFSAAATSDSSWLLLGAPGLMSWTGGVVEYKITKGNGGSSNVYNQQPIVNFKASLQEYSYLGYSVDSGIFEPEDGITLGVAGAPRGGELLGEVLVFSLGGNETDHLDIRAHLLGHQRGEYFGAAILVTDLNADGRADLIVGAPMYATRSASKDCCYNQGAVYVYINKKTESGFELEFRGKLSGSGRSGAMFGYSLAELGDVDGDNYTDIAIGAPFEEYRYSANNIVGVEGGGAVYIYRGCPKGMKSNYSQRIFPNKSHLNGFGFSISRGVDLDRNGCKDLAVGTRSDVAVAVFRCTPTLVVMGSIKVHVESRSVVMHTNSVGIPGDSTGFTVEYCISVKKTKVEWSKASVRINASMVIDLRTVFEPWTVSPDHNEYCKNLTYVVQSHGNTTAVRLKLELEPITEMSEGSEFNGLKARIGEDSKMSIRRTVYFIDCGADMICQPQFDVNFTSLSESPAYVPGTNEPLGVTLSLRNTGEPAYGACVKITLGSETSPVRVPGDCTLKGSNLTCNLVAPFSTGAAVNWTIPLQKSSNLTKDIHFEYDVQEICDDVSSKRGIIIVKVEPKANITLKGHTELNSTIVSRSTLQQNTPIEFDHDFDMFNYGPSDWNNVQLAFKHSPEVSVKQVRCVPPVQQTPGSDIGCKWSMRVGQPYSAKLQLSLLPKDHEMYLEGKSLKATTNATLVYGKTIRTVEVSTYFILEPAKPIWPIILAVIVGLLIIALIIYIMYRTGFFVRSKKQELKKLRTESVDAEVAGNPGHSDSVEDLIDDETSHLNTSEPLASTQPSSRL